MVFVTVTPRSITMLMDWEDARNGWAPDRPSPQAILNGGLGYRSLGTSER